MLLEIENLTKTYHSKNRKIRALKKVSFTVEKGDHLAIIGANGSGKTTLMKIITQLSHPDYGKVKLDGKKMTEKDKGRFGLMLCNSMVYHRLTLRQNLNFFASLYNVQNPGARVEELLKMLGLTGKADDLAESLSEGLLSKLAFARAIIHEPEILILDEPTTGVDPISTDILHWHIKKYETVIFSSHNLYEVINIANKLLVLNNGEEVYFGSVEKFKKKNDIEKTKSSIMEVYSQ